MPKPDLTQTNTEQSESQENQEQQEQQEQTSQQTQQQIDWENEQNIYKKRYSDSQAQVQPLVRTLQQFAEYDHQTRTWKPKSAAVSQSQNQGGNDFERVLSGYDPEFVKALGGYTQKQIADAIAKKDAENQASQEYTTMRDEGRALAISEFGSEFDFAKEGKMNSESPLYQLANQIIHNKYALFNPDGSFAKYNNPEAEYLATVEAYAILAKRSKQQPGNKAQLGAIQGKGTKSAGVRRQLSFEEYMKSPDAEKDAYDLSQMGG